MTVAALSPSASYVENGVTLAFSVPFRFLDGAHLEVTRILAGGGAVMLTQGVDFTASGGATDDGGTVLLMSTIAGATIRIRRVTPRSQQLDYVTGDTFPAESHEQAIDRAMLIDQEQDQKIADTAARALMWPEGEQAVPLPSKASFAGKYFAGDVAGNPVPASGTGNDAALRADLANPAVGPGLVAFSQAAPYAPDSVGARLQQWADPIDPPWNAVGDDVANDAVALQAMFSDVTVKEIDASRRNRFRITSGITLNRSGVRARLAMTYAPTGNGSGFSAGTTVPDATTQLSADASGRTITVASATGAAVGKLIVVQHRNPADYARGNGADARFHTSRITKVNGSQITFQDSLGEPVLTSYVHSIMFFTPLKDLDLELDLTQISAKKAITAITKSNPAVLTIPGHGLPNGAIGTITGPNSASETTNMFEIHGGRGAITVIDANQISIPINSTTFSTYLGGATFCVEAQGVSLGALDNCRIRLKVRDNDTAGAGLTGYYQYDCDIKAEADNCGNQNAAAIQLYGPGASVIAHRTGGSDGFGTVIHGGTGCHYNDLGSAGAEFGRGSKYQAGHGNTMYGSAITNSAFVGLAIAHGERRFTAIGFNANSSDTPSVQTGGIWLSSCNNQGVLIGCKGYNNLGLDLQVNETDILECHGCEFDKIDNNGKLRIFGNGSRPRPVITGTGDTAGFFDDGYIVRATAQFPADIYAGNTYYQRIFSTAGTNGQSGFQARARDGGGVERAVTFYNAGGNAGFNVATGFKYTFQVNNAEVMALRAATAAEGIGVKLNNAAASTSYANDAAAAAGGVAIGETYRNGSIVQVRVA